MSSEKSSIRVIGRRELVSFPALSINRVEAKIDTGAYTCSIHCSELKIVEEDGSPVLLAVFSEHPSEAMPGVAHRFKEFFIKRVRNSFGESEERYFIRTPLKVGRKRIRVTLSLTNRGSMRYPILIGRKPLKGKFLIDVNLLHTNGIKLSSWLKTLLQTK